MANFSGFVVDSPPLITGIDFPVGFIYPNGTANVQYVQRVWDTGGGGRWCYFQKSAIDPTPGAAETTPNYTGAISAHSIIAVL